MKEITRTQTGVRLESRLLKVLKALATELDLSLGDLLEGIVLHAFEGKTPFSAATLKKVYDHIGTRVSATRQQKELTFALAGAAAALLLAAAGSSWLLRIT